MPREPLNLFSAAGDADQVRQFLLTRYPHAAVSGPADDWTAIDIPFPDGKQITVLHDRSYYTSERWDAQKAGMVRYFERWPLDRRREPLLAVIDGLRFALATRFDPEYTDPHDDRLTVVRELTTALDGVVFSPSALRDARLRVLASADGEVDADAQWPATEPVADPIFELAAEPAPPHPPTPLRIARRTVALLLVTKRGVLERDVDPDQRAANHARLLEWAEELGIDDEFEPWERAALHTPPGSLDPQTAANAVWRVEGLAVLAWALHRVHLPRYDQTADVDTAWNAVGFFHDAKVRELYVNPVLRPEADREAYRKQARGYHRRLLDVSGPSWEGRRAFAADAQTGGFDAAAFSLIDGELSVQGVRADHAPPAILGTCLSTAFERHLAIEWVCHGPEVYSDAEV